MIGVGFYGNEEVHKGVLEVTTAGQDADITLNHMGLEVRIEMKSILCMAVYHPLEFFQASCFNVRVVYIYMF